MWPGVPAAFAADTKAYNNPPPDVGPLIPADQEALTHFMALRYGVFIHWNPATVAGKEISWSREREIPSAEYDQLYKRFNPVEFDADAWVRMLKDARSEEHTSELQSLMRISYAVFCLKKQKPQAQDQCQPPWFHATQARAFMRMLQRAYNAKGRGQSP